MISSYREYAKWTNTEHAKIVHLKKIIVDVSLQAYTTQFGRFVNQ